MTLEHKNTQLKTLVANLKTLSIDQKTGIWKRIALELEKPTRMHRIVNLTKIEKYGNENDTIIVPGKVLAGGELNKKITIIAHSFSRDAVEKISKKGTIMTIEDAMKKYPKGNNLKIIG